MYSSTYVENVWIIAQNGEPFVLVDRCRPAGFYRSTGRPSAGMDDRSTVLGRPGSTGGQPGRPAGRPTNRSTGTGRPPDPAGLPGPVDRIHFFISSVCGPMAPILAKTRAPIPATFHLLPTGIPSPKSETAELQTIPLATMHNNKKIPDHVTTMTVETDAETIPKNWATSQSPIISPRHKVTMPLYHGCEDVRLTAWA